MRPDELPLYQAEQIKLDDEYYCMLMAPSGDSKIEDVFSKELDLKYVDQISESIINKIADIKTPSNNNS